MPNYDIPLTGEQLDLIGVGLFELPYKHVQPLVAYLREQVREQDAARAALGGGGTDAEPAADAVAAETPPTE